MDGAVAPCPPLGQASTPPGPGWPALNPGKPQPPPGSVLGARLALHLDLQQQGGSRSPSTPCSVAHFLGTLTSLPSPEHLQPPTHTSILPLGSSAQVSLSRDTAN